MKWGNISAQKLETECLKILLCQFHCKASPSGVSLESPALENIAKILESRAEVAQNHDSRKAGLAYSFSLKVKWGYISAEKLESDPLKGYAFCI